MSTEGGDDGGENGRKKHNHPQENPLKPTLKYLLEKSGKSKEEFAALLREKYVFYKSLPKENKEGAKQDQNNDAQNQPSNDSESRDGIRNDFSPVSASSVETHESTQGRLETSTSFEESERNAESPNDRGETPSPTIGKEDSRSSEIEKELETVDTNVVEQFKPIEENNPSNEEKSSTKEVSANPTVTSCTISTCDDQEPVCNDDDDVDICVDDSEIADPVRTEAVNFLELLENIISPDDCQDEDGGTNLVEVADELVDSEFVAATLLSPHQDETDPYATDYETGYVRGKSPKHSLKDEEFSVTIICKQTAEDIYQAMALSSTTGGSDKDFSKRNKVGTSAESKMELANSDSSRKKRKSVDDTETEEKQKTKRQKRNSTKKRRKTVEDKCDDTPSYQPQMPVLVENTNSESCPGSLTTPDTAEFNPAFIDVIETVESSPESVIIPEAEAAEASIMEMDTELSMPPPPTPIDNIQPEVRQQIHVPETQAADKNRDYPEVPNQSADCTNAAIIENETCSTAVNTSTPPSNLESNTEETSVPNVTAALTTESTTENNASTPSDVTENGAEQQETRVDATTIVANESEVMETSREKISDFDLGPLVIDTSAETTACDGQTGIEAIQTETSEQTVTVDEVVAEPATTQTRSEETECRAGVGEESDVGPQRQSVQTAPEAPSVEASTTQWDPLSYYIITNNIQDSEDFPVLSIPERTSTTTSVEQQPASATVTNTETESTVTAESTTSESGPTTITSSLVSTGLQATENEQNPSIIETTQSATSAEEANVSTGSSLTLGNTIVLPDGVGTGVPDVTVPSADTTQQNDSEENENVPDIRLRTDIFEESESPTEVEKPTETAAETTSGTSTNDDTAAYNASLFETLHATLPVMNQFMGKYLELFKLMQSSEGSPPEQNNFATRFRALIGVTQLTFAMSSRFDNALLSLRAKHPQLNLQPPLPWLTKETDMTIDAMSDYFELAMEAFFLLRCCTSDNRKRALEMVHSKLSRILHYYMFARDPSQSEKLFLNVYSTLMKKPNFRKYNDPSGFCRIYWDKVRTVSGHVDAKYGIIDHNLVGLDGFRERVQKMKEIHYREKQMNISTTTTATATSTVVGNSQMPSATCTIVNSASSTSPSQQQYTMQNVGQVVTTMQQQQGQHTPPAAVEAARAIQLEAQLRQHQQQQQQQHTMPNVGQQQGQHTPPAAGEVARAIQLEAQLRQHQQQQHTMLNVGQSVTTIQQQGQHTPPAAGEAARVVQLEIQQLLRQQPHQQRPQSHPGPSFSQQQRVSQLQYQARVQPNLQLQQQQRALQSQQMQVQQQPSFQPQQQQVFQSQQRPRQSVNHFAEQQQNLQMSYQLQQTQMQQQSTRGQDDEEIVCIAMVNSPVPSSQVASTTPRQQQPPPNYVIASDGTPYPQPTQPIVRIQYDGNQIGTEFLGATNPIANSRSSVLSHQNAVPQVSAATHQNSTQPSGNANTEYATLQQLLQRDPNQNRGSNYRGTSEGVTVRAQQQPNVVSGTRPSLTNSNEGQMYAGLHQATISRVSTPANPQITSVQGNYVAQNRNHQQTQMQTPQPGSTVAPSQEVIRKRIQQRRVANQPTQNMANQQSMIMSSLQANQQRAAMAALQATNQSQQVYGYPTTAAHPAAVSSNQQTGSMAVSTAYASQHQTWTSQAGGYLQTSQAPTYSSWMMNNQAQSSQGIQTQARSGTSPATSAAYSRATPPRAVTSQNNYSQNVSQQQRVLSEQEMIAQANTIFLPDANGSIRAVPSNQSPTHQNAGQVTAAAYNTDQTYSWP